MSHEVIIDARYKNAEAAIDMLKQAALNAARLNAFALDGCRDMLSEIEKVCREAGVATFPQGTSAIDMVRQMAQALAEERLARASSSKKLARFLQAAHSAQNLLADPESGPPDAERR